VHGVGRLEQVEPRKPTPLGVRPNLEGTPNRSELPFNPLTATAWPAAARRLAISLPSPRELPVTSATRPLAMEFMLDGPARRCDVTRPSPRRASAPPKARRGEMHPRHERKERRVNEDHPVRFSVEYPDRPLNRLTTAFRIFTVIPIAIVLGVIGGYAGGGGYDGGGDAPTIAIGGTGLLFLPPLLMIVFREKYPRWWYDWNLELLRFTNRVGTYVALMNDRYPSADERQWVRLDFPYPDARRDLNRWLPLVKWFLAIPHYIVLFFLYLAVILLVIGAWFAILFTGRYPRGIFDFVEGVIRWHNRVVAYAFILVTDRYPPFSLSQQEVPPPTPERPIQPQA
jgi:hypothetical protein